ncbi:MAG: modA 2 [Proteobacteria bacterium]|nr:modA 2 [Pseudomonadota bacterium]
MFRSISLAVTMLCCVHAAQADVRLFAAGSLKGALSEVSAAFTQQTGIPVKGEYGPSGILRERIEKNEAVDVFTSADMNHPRKLAASGRAPFVVRFTGNRLCAMAKPEVGLNSDNVLEKALSPAIKLGTSTPLSDPSGDYTWKVFDKAEALKPGATQTLKTKALQLVGGPTSEVIPAGRSAVPYMFATGKADMFIAYCTTGQAARGEGVTLTVVNLPSTLAQSADYGMVVLTKSTEAAQLALFIMSEPAQAILAKWGFEASGSR